ncbi:uncharacterized protein J3D65DRAFT_677581 [Phyllosticta citribraziliensis]|uniref:ATP-dependent RNA helicase n=1 Tax=Phyllosticta citribraziliensis TaxID=989973 RepID=A0ABR1LKQ9_9PEZI
MASSECAMPGTGPSSLSTEEDAVGAGGANEPSISPFQATGHSTLRSQPPSSAGNEVNDQQPGNDQNVTEIATIPAVVVPQHTSAPQDWAYYRPPQFLLDNLNRLGIWKPSDVQREFLRRYVRSGRTQARGAVPTVVVLCPSRQSVLYTFSALKALSLNGPIRAAKAEGFMSLKEQGEQLDAGAEVLVATPGRLWGMIVRGYPLLDAEFVIMNGTRALLYNDVFLSQFQRLFHKRKFPCLVRSDRLLTKSGVFAENALFSFVSCRYSDDLEDDVIDFLEEEDTLLVSTRASTLATTPMRHTNMAFDPIDEVDVETSSKIARTMEKMSGKVIIFANMSQIDALSTFLRGTRRLVVLRDNNHKGREETCRECESAEVIITTDSAVKNITIAAVECVIHAGLPPMASESQSCSPVARFFQRNNRIALSEFAGWCLAFYSQRDEHLFVKLAHHLVRSGQQELTRFALLDRFRQGACIAPVHPVPTPAVSNGGA